MRSASPIAAAATVLLHVALVAMVVLGLSISQQQLTPPIPLEIKLLPAQPPAPLPVAPPAPSPPPEKKRQEPKPRAEPKPTLPPREVTSPQIKAPDVSFDTKPSVSGTTAVPVMPMATAPAPAPVSPVKTAVSDATYAATNRKPTYPRLSRSNDEQGTVLLRVLVRADGTAGTVEIKNSSGYPLLDESAKSTVQTWRFKPATVDGKPIAEWYQLAVPFTLQNN